MYCLLMHHELHARYFGLKHVQQNHIQVFLYKKRIHKESHLSGRNSSVGDLRLHPLSVVREAIGNLANNSHKTGLYLIVITVKIV